MYILSSISEGVALINSSLHPHLLKSQLSTAAPIRRDIWDTRSFVPRLGSQLVRVLKQMFEPESQSFCVMCLGG